MTNPSELQVADERIERIEVFRGRRPTDGLYLEHYFRYKFATRFVEKRSVLDCACGTGYGTFLLARNAKEVIGVDNSARALKIANANWSRRNVCYRLLDIKDLDSMKIGFDVIVCFETIEHLEEPNVFFEKALGRLNPHGLLIISTPNKEVYRAGLQPNPFHVREYTETEFAEVLSKYFIYTTFFGQINVSHEERLEKAAQCLRMKPAVVKAVTNYAIISPLYVFTMKRRFSVVLKQESTRYRYLVAVCQNK